MNGGTRTTIEVFAQLYNTGRSDHTSVLSETLEGYLDVAAALEEDAEMRFSGRITDEGSNTMERKKRKKEKK